MLSTRSLVLRGNCRASQELRISGNAVQPLAAPLGRVQSLADPSVIAKRPGLLQTSPDAYKG